MPSASTQNLRMRWMKLRLQPVERKRVQPAAEAARAEGDLDAAAEQLGGGDADEAPVERQGENDDDRVGDKVSEGADGVRGDVFEGAVGGGRDPGEQAGDDGDDEDGGHDAIARFAEEDDAGDAERGEHERADELIAEGEMVDGARHSGSILGEVLGHVFARGT